MPDYLQLSVHVNASPETVYRFLSEPELFKKWMGPGARLTAETVSVRYPTGESAMGTIRESIPNEKIVFGWGYSGGNHGLNPDSTKVTIQLEAVAGGTKVTLTHTGLSKAQQTEHSKGWTHYLAQLTSSAADLGFALALPIAVKKYIQAWNEADVEVRSALLDACWEPDGVFRDSMGSADGRAHLLQYIGGAQQFVPAFQLELAGVPEQCHGYYRYPWLIRMPDGAVMGRGTNFGQISVTGRFTSAIGFWDKP